MANSESVVRGRSELPVDIVRHIVSFLRTERDGIRASSLSKTWLRAWRTLSNLEFDEEHFIEQFPDPFAEIIGEIFMIYVNRSLQRYREQNIPIEELRLTSYTYPLAIEWIQAALENGVKKLELRADSNSTFPSVIFGAKSLVDLWLESGTLLGRGDQKCIRLELPESIKCRNLKSLHLADVCLDEFELESIITSCQMIEYLKLECCEGLRNFKITRVPKLKKLVYGPMRNADYEQSIEVEAPNLAIFCCLYGWSCFLSLSTSHILKRLEIEDVDYIPDELFVDFKNKFPNLEELIIDNCYSMQRIGISSASLRKMELLECGQLEELQIDTPSMTQFGYSGCFQNRGYIVRIPKVSFARVSKDCTSDIHVTSLREATSKLFITLKEFLKSFSPSKINLSLNIGPMLENVIFKLEKRMVASLIFDAAQVEELSLTIDLEDSYDVSTIGEEVLDAFFWACRPKTIRLDIHHNLAYEQLTEIISKNLMITRNEGCYHSRRIKLWEQSLKEVKLLSEKKQEPEPMYYGLQKFSKECVFELEWETS